MKNPPPIPEKIYIKPLCEYLGLSDMAQDAQLDVLKSHSQDRGLLFTFHDSVKAIQAGKPIGNVYDDSDGVIECNPASEDDIEYVETAKTFILRNHFTQNGQQFTYISRFKESGISYDIISENNYAIDVYDLDLSHVYVKKSDFINFMNKLRTPSPEKKQPYQDINSEYYSPELDLAIQLHHALHVENFLGRNPSIESRVSAWLNINRQNEDIPNAKLKRLSSIIGIIKKRVTLQPIDK
jgi:hypothetical protein